MSAVIARCRPRKAWAGLGALASALLLASCHMLPGAQKEPAAVPTEAAAPAPAFGPLPPQARAGAATPPAPPTPGSEAKTFAGTGVFVNPKPKAPGAAAGPEEASLNFEALDVREVAKVILGDYLKESYTVHPQVTGTVTFRTIRPIPRKELLPTLEMLLRQNNAAVVIEEGVYKILPVAAVRGSVSPQLGGSSQPIPPGYSVVVVPLKFVGAAEMGRLLEPFAADNTIRIDAVRNLMIIAGNQREMKHLLDTIELFDVDWLSGYSIGLFPIKSADVKTLVADMEKVFAGAPTTPLTGIVRVIPIERLNALLIVTTQPKYLEMARTWLDRLDQMGGTSGGSRFFVYYVKNGKAENLAQLIGDLFSGRRSTTPSGPSLAPGSRPAEIRSVPSTMGGSPPPPAPTGPTSATFSLQGGSTTSGEVRVIADKDTNSLLILATPSDYDIIENALRKLDVVPRQVLVEVMLAEVTLTDELSLGIDWFIRGRNNSNTTGRISRGALPATPAGAVTFDPRASALQLISLSGTDVRAVLNALGADGRAQVLASPQIMVLDNQKAQIKVGDKISVQTQSQTGVNTSSGLVSTFQYLETGVLLSVTPRINSNNQVTLEVNQEVSVPDPESISPSNPNPNVNTRSAQTSVVVASGDSIVMAGLIQENKQKSGSGVPLLSKIPVLGAAFGSQGYNRRRTELVLVITPKIVSDARQAQEVSEELRKKLPALEGIIPKFDRSDKTNGAAPAGLDRK